MANVDADTVAAALSDILDEADWSSATERAIKAQLKQQLGVGVTKHFPLIKVFPGTPPLPGGLSLLWPAPRPGQARLRKAASLSATACVALSGLLTRAWRRLDAAAAPSAANGGKRTAEGNPQPERKAAAARTAVCAPAHTRLCPCWLQA